MNKLHPLTLKKIQERDEQLRHEANSPASLQEKYYASSVMTRALPLSDEKEYIEDPNAKEGQELPMEDDGLTLEDIEDLMAEIAQKEAEIRKIQQDPDWNEHERADKINYRLNKIANYRKTIENWFNLQIANGCQTPEFNELFAKYNEAKRAR